MSIFEASPYFDKRAMTAHGRCEISQILCFGNYDLGDLILNILLVR